MKNNNLPLILIYVAILVVVNGILFYQEIVKFDWNGIGLIVGSGLTLALYSFLYRDNPLFKVAENLYVGVSAAYVLAITYYDGIRSSVFVELGELFKNRETLPASIFYVQVATILIATLLGLMIFTRLFQKVEWVSRIPFAYIMGFGAGVLIPFYITAYILKQLQFSMVPLWTDSGLQFDALVIFVGVLCTMTYFFFSIEHKGAVGFISKVGVWFLMLSFGASFGYTVMARVSLLIDRVSFLFHDWIPLIKG